MTVNSDSTRQKWMKFAFTVTGSIFLQSYWVLDNVASHWLCLNIIYLHALHCGVKGLFKRGQILPVSNLDVVKIPRPSILKIRNSSVHLALKVSRNSGLSFLFAMELKSLCIAFFQTEKEKSTLKWAFLIQRIQKAI